MRRVALLLIGATTAMLTGLIGCTVEERPAVVAEPASVTTTAPEAPPPATRRGDWYRTSAIVRLGTGVLGVARPVGLVRRPLGAATTSRGGVDGVDIRALGPARPRLGVAPWALEVVTVPRD